MIRSSINGTEITNAGKLVLGTDGFGTEMDEALCFSMLDRFVEAGGNIIDTASVYADWHGMGKSMSEKTIGKWLKQTHKREKIILATKGGHPELDSMEVSRLSKGELLYDFEHSLMNLNTDYIDIYWLHKDDAQIPPEELVGIMNEILNTGKARYIAASNWPYDRLKRANDYAKAHGLQPFIAGQIQHSLAKVNMTALGKDIYAMTEEEYAKYRQDTMNVFAFSSQAKGFFALMEKGGSEALPEHVKNEYLNDENLKLFHRLSQLAKECNISVSALALYALVMDDEVNTFAQIGPRKMEYLEDSLGFGNLSLSQEQRNYLCAAC